MPLCPKCDHAVPSFEYYEALNRQAFVQRCPACRSELKTLHLQRYRQMAVSFCREDFRSAVNAYFGEEVLRSTYYSLPSLALTEMCVGVDFGHSPIIEVAESMRRLSEGFAALFGCTEREGGARHTYVTGGAVFASNPVEAIYKAFFAIRKEFNRDVKRVTMGRDAYNDLRWSPKLREVMVPTEEGSLTFVGVPISLRVTDEDTYRVDLHMEIDGHPAVESFEVLPAELPPTRA